MAAEPASNRNRIAAGARSIPDPRDFLRDLSRRSRAGSTAGRSFFLFPFFSLSRPPPPARRKIPSKRIPLNVMGFLLQSLNHPRASGLNDNLILVSVWINFNPIFAPTRRLGIRHRLYLVIHLARLFNSSESSERDGWWVLYSFGWPLASASFTLCASLSLAPLTRDCRLSKSERHKPALVISDTSAAFRIGDRSSSGKSKPR